MLYLLICSLGVAVEDVLFDGARKQDRLLRHDADGLPQRVQVDKLDVVAPDADTALCGIIEPLKQLSISRIKRDEMSSERQCIMQRHKHTPE